MKLGVQTTGWCSTWSNEQLHVIDTIKGYEFDFVEFSLTRLDLFDVKAVKNRLNDAQLEACTSTLLLLDSQDITNPDLSIRQQGVQYLKQCVKATADIGAHQLSGVLHSRLGKKIAGRPTETDWHYASECLREVAQFARDYGVQLGLEPINRYESYLVNTCRQALDLIDLINEPNIGVHLDTYHMNMEEKQMDASIMLAGNKLVHLHLNENDWGVAGTGHIQWDDIFKALSELDFTGYASIESVVHLQGDPVWRQLAEDGPTLVTEGVQFLRRLRDKYKLSRV
ncbi:sugar phosphate isomerase/epimerase [Paenibacillus frigoriresistens]|uniref:sugar phosphate isomerase/epimerase family protein n=1 Tax=Paenibacillus alginolyticus TaxID=59839 RepID=UPI001565E293|nr:sugar phosphate isomerase/epimerase family protein [Paenibacillus frigoriresistens]NRF93755.1 sugar phosphate isomerase/epimerase [Paenibacillus frigoriresistens]